MRGKNLFHGLCAAVVLALVGCGDPGSLDERDERDPNLRRARDAKGVQDYEGAVTWYNKALDRKPDLARAHLELGLLYDQQLNDDLRAIYHYERYLELRPEAEKKEIVKELIRHARISYAASLPGEPAGAVREIEMLRKEVQTLRSLLADAQGGATNLSSARTLKAKTTAAETGASPPPPAAKSSTAYVVQSGDTLSRIAGKVYGDTGKWKEIYDANRGSLASPQSIKVGDTLVIPR